MTREPSSASMRLARSRGGYDRCPKPAPEPPPAPPPSVPRRRNFKVVVEPAKPKPPPPPAGTRGYHSQAQRDAVTKLTTTTEALTAEERRIVRGYRLSGGAGPTAETAERARMEKEIRDR